MKMLMDTFSKSRESITEMKIVLEKQLGNVFTSLIQTETSMRMGLSQLIGCFSENVSNKPRITYTSDIDVKTLPSFSDGFKFVFNSTKYDIPDKLQTILRHALSTYEITTSGDKFEITTSSTSGEGSTIKCEFLKRTINCEVQSAPQSLIENLKSYTCKSNKICFKLTPDTYQAILNEW
jgi:hypothetical protein